MVQKLQVKKNDVKIILGSNTEELDGYDVVAARSKDGDEPSDYIISAFSLTYTCNMAINIWMDQIKKY